MVVNSATVRYDNDKLVALCHVLCPGDPIFADEVRLAIERPDAYLARFRERLEEDRLIDEPIPILPWIALLDGLIDRGQLVEVDWRASASDVMHNIDQLLPNHLQEADRWGWVDRSMWDYTPTERFLMAIGIRLLEDGFLLAYFVYGSDSYPLLLLDQERFARAQELTRQTGYGNMALCAGGDTR